MSILDWIKFVAFAVIPNIPAFIHSRPAVADKRIISVRTTYLYYCSLANTIIQVHQPARRDEEIQEIGSCGASTLYLTKALRFNEVLPSSLGIVMEDPQLFALQEQSLYTALLSAIQEGAK